MTTIRAEIRKWLLKSNTIQGKIYKDTAEVYDDGEDVVIIGIKKIAESTNFFTAETDFGIYKLEKEEELK